MAAHNAASSPAIARGLRANLSSSDPITRGRDVNLHSSVVYLLRT